MKITFIKIILLFLPVLGYSQNPNMPAKHDAIWLSGYGSGGNDPQFGGLKFDFREYPMQVIDEHLNIEFQISGTTMCNSEGELIFSCNGDEIFDASDNVMDNGDGINPEENAPQTRINQSIFTLPAPDNEDLYYMFHSELFWVLDDTITLDGYYAGTFDFYYSLIDMSMNEGLGSVIEKNQLVLNDTIDFGKLTAVKHANGRDWWFLVPEYWSNNYYTFLLDPTGIIEYPKQTVELVRYPGLGQAVFSPDGSTFVITGSRDTDNGGIHIDFFDFDRCTGLLSNQQRSFFSEITTLGKSVVISPNSKYAYFFANGKYYRYDLTEEDIPNSEELISDWMPFYQNGVIPVIPWASQLGPDGKIYIASQSTVSYMDVIHDPDMNSVEECNLEQGGLELPNRNNGTIANHPNYRLGPIDGSSCDTLGIDNLPVANFRYEVFTDTVLFRDLSAGAPTNWFWVFGDGAATNGQHQEKRYNGGSYEVCLTVSNENGSDTWCDTVQILTTDVLETQQVSLQTVVFPNPSSGMILLQSEQNLPFDSQMKIYNQAGQIVYDKALIANTNKQEIDLYHIENGIYFYEVLIKGFSVGKGKLVLHR